MSNEQQAQELNLWGLGGEARRNIVTFLISILTLAVIALFGVIIQKDFESKEMHEELIRCKEEEAIKIEALKNEQLQILNAINKTLEDERKNDKKRKR